MVDGPAVEWRHSNWGKRRANTEGIEKIAAILKERTGGKFTIKIGYGEMFSKDKENLDSIKLNAIEMADMCNFYHPGKNPAWMVFSLAVPAVREPGGERGGGRRDDEASAAGGRHGAVERHAVLLHHPAAVRVHGQRQAAQDARRLEGAARARARRRRRGFRQARRHLSTVPAVELYTALERGTVDAASFPFTYAHAAYQLHTISTWYTSNLAPGNAGCSAVVNKEAFAKLPPQYQKLLMEAQPEANKAMIAAYREADKVNLPPFKQKLDRDQLLGRGPQEIPRDRRQAGLGEVGGRQQGQVRCPGRARRNAQGAREGQRQARTDAVK